MAPRKKVAGPTPVDALIHQDKRTNIPTDELRGFVVDDEKTPTLASYPRWRSERDRSLDPQLVWRGKDELDLDELQVPAVPIYIQEKVQPRVLIENLRKTAAAGEPKPELALFDDFNGIDFEDLVDFYQHEQNWTNRLIVGDSLLVMTSLAEKEAMKGKIQTIYFDPPYGIGFGSNWQVSTQSTDVSDGKLRDLTRQPEQIRAFRDTWQDGINSYLTYLRDRLTVARELLTESGSLFVQIGDENVHLVRDVVAEVFGPENVVSQIAFKKTTGGTGDFVPGTVDYLIWATKDRTKAKFRALFRDKLFGGEGAGAYKQVELPGTGPVEDRRRYLSADERDDLSLLPSGSRIFRSSPLTSDSQGREKGEGAASWFPVKFAGGEYTPSTGRWKTNEEGMERLRAARRLIATEKSLSYVRYLDDFPAFPLGNLWTDTQSGSGMEKVYVVQTNTKVIARCLLMTSDPGDLVLDPTCGSGATATVAELHGRRWITIDTSRVAVALARTRLMALRLPWYLLADSQAGRKMEAELSAAARVDGPLTNDLRQGFVYRRVPHITLKGIAQNPAISSDLNPEEIKQIVARESEQELLLDQPIEDRRIVRVCGPFTVESLSPHRLLSEDDQPDSEDTTSSSPRFEDTVLENLAKAGVQNRIRDQRLEFTAVEPWAGTWIHAVGHFEGADGAARRAAISLGGEYGTVGSDQIREAAKEALKGVGFDQLLVCGFAFDAMASATASEFKPDSSDGWAVTADERKIGRLPVLLVRMNPDLSMGDELLKKTGAGNLFMVFGEPDVLIDTNGGVVEIEVRGVDVYDPTTGEIRSDNTNDIACWFIDSNYNGESFFVRDAYFTGTNDPYNKLKQALKAEIDRDAWASLYRTRSRPFAKPETGRIAVKVINHHGDEVLKVYDVA